MENVLTPLQWATDTEIEDDGLPEPVGYRMLVKPYEVESVSKGGIVLIEESKQYAEVACIAGQVVKMGDGCYKKDARFEKPWCQRGDWVVFAKHCGQKFELKRADGKTEKYLFINDDDVRATAKDPARIRMYL